MADPFHDSPNALFDTRVHSVNTLSPTFVRVTVTGSQLRHFTPRGLDQRIKILLPNGDRDDVYPPELDPTHRPDEVLPERQWRQIWRGLAPDERPTMRSYTVSESRPHCHEVDLDFYVHANPGPASTWALNARPGNRLLLSGPDVRHDHRSHGVQWRPGAATWVLLAGDETAFPALRGIVADLDPAIRAELIIETDEPSHADWLTTAIGDRTTTTITRRTDLPGGQTLVNAVEKWIGRHGAEAARSRTGFYAWSATESTRVGAIRQTLLAAGVDAPQVHAQGYWNDRPRPS